MSDSENGGTSTRKPKGGKPRSKQASKPSSKSATKAVAPAHSDSSGVEELDPKQVPQKARRGQRAAPAKENGQVPKGKGKAKATNASDIELIDQTDAESLAAGLANAINSSNTRKRNDHEVTRLRRQLEASQQREDALSKQLEELLRVRQTGAEELLDQLRDQYERKLKAKDLYIVELNAALAIKEPLLNSGKKDSGVELLTRGAAEEEKRQLEKTLAALKEKLAEKEEIIQSKAEEERELRYELQLTKESANTKSRQPAAHTVLGSDEPKNAEVMKFYEDLTNMIVPNIRQSKSPYLDLDEWTLTCIYTFVKDDLNYSLNFSLKFHYALAPDEAEPVANRDQLISSARYIPLELNKEKPDFVKRLGFLNSTFIFERDQLPLFLRSINTKLEEALSPNTDDADEDTDMVED